MPEPGSTPAAMQLEDYLTGFIAFLVGGGFAWWWRSRRELPERMRLVEHFERRARMAEADQEQAIRTLNENELRMRKIQGTYDDLRGRIGELEGGLQTVGDESSGLRGQLEAREEELARAKAKIGRLEGAREDMVARTSAAEKAGTKATREIEGVRRDLEDARHEVARLEADAARAAEEIQKLGKRADDGKGAIVVAIVIERGRLLEGVGQGRTCHQQRDYRHYGGEPFHVRAVLMAVILSATTLAALSVDVHMSSLG